MGAPLDVVRGYYAALETGDADAIAVSFTDDAVHYHHSNAKNRSGDLLGFDHAGRGHTTLR